MSLFWMMFLSILCYFFFDNIKESGIIQIHDEQMLAGHLTLISAQHQNAKYKGLCALWIQHPKQTLISDCRGLDAYSGIGQKTHIDAQHHIVYQRFRYYGRQNAMAEQVLIKEIVHSASGKPIFRNTDAALEDYVSDTNHRFAFWVLLELYLLMCIMVEIWKIRYCAKHESLY